MIEEHDVSGECTPYSDSDAAITLVNKQNVESLKAGKYTQTHWVSQTDSVTARDEMTPARSRTRVIARVHTCDTPTAAEAHCLTYLAAAHEIELTQPLA